MFGVGARHDRHHRDDRVHGHRLQHPDAGHDDRPRGRHRLHAVHPGPLPHRAAPHRRPRGGRRHRRRHRRLGRRLRRPHRADRALGALRSSASRSSPRMGLAAAGTVLHRRPRRADPAARDPRPAQVQGLRRPGPQLPRRSATTTARSSTTASAGPGSSAARPVARRPRWSSSASARSPSRCKDLHLAFPTDSTASADTTQRKASDLIADAFGPGREAPLLVVVDGRDVAEADRGAAYRRGRGLGRRPGRRRQRPDRRR